MISWFKKPKITFECLIPGVERIMPMIPARDYRHAWVNSALEEYKHIRSQPNFGTEKLVHTARCPGIFTLMRHGWVMRTWQDITIQTYEGEDDFTWTTPIDQKLVAERLGDYVGSHAPQQFASYMKNWPANTLKTVVKINSGWFCHVPKGFYLLEMPVAYADENRFTTLQGFFSKEQGPVQMNPQLLWHAPVGKTLIKAGTPIAQYLLVPKDKVDMDIKAVKQISEQEVFMLMNQHRFVKNYAEIKRTYGDK